MASAERDALVALFRSTHGDSWHDKRNWATDADLSTWSGVEVDKDGRVTELYLISDNVRGCIPGALGALTNLTVLYFGSDKLTGPIPDALGALTNLVKLDFRNNQLTGSIPEALGTLTNLLWLNLCENQLTGRIPEVLGALTKLTMLGLGPNHLTGPIPEALGALTNLTKLYLDENKLSGPIPAKLGALVNLELLRLNDNQLTGPIPEELGALTKIKRLHVEGNQLTGTVPLSVWNLPRSKVLNISGNLLTRFTDPKERDASTRVVLDCMERLERLAQDNNSYRAERGLFTADNPWEFPPAAVVVNGRESIRKYFDTWKQCDFSLEEVHALKIVVVGAYGAGKTSLAMSIKRGRGDRTNEVDENSRTTVGVDLHSLKLRNGTECKIYDVAGQITYYGLHQFFLTDRAVYVVVCDATKFEGLSATALDKAIEDNILEWVSLLHMRTPLCTVMLVASHFDMLHGTAEDNEQLLGTVEKRFVALHNEWKSLRDDNNSWADGRMTVLPGVFPVGCLLESESASYSARDGLQAVDDALSKQKSVSSHLPPSWAAARRVLEQIGSAHDGSSDSTTSVDDHRRPWELRSVIHAKFKSFVQEGRGNTSKGEGHQIPSSFLYQLDDNGIRDSMDGAIELRAFSGTVISHDVFVVLDVMWLAGVLKPILDHRGVTENRMGVKLFADKRLETGTHLVWANELVGRGILRKGFARFLWSLNDQVAEGVDDSHEMGPAKFEEILEGIGVTIPLPEPGTVVDEIADDRTLAIAEPKSPGDGAVRFREYGADLLVIMRLPLEADAQARENLLLARQLAIDSRITNGGSSSLKAVVKFDHGGAPHGLPERVMALSYKIGEFSLSARWRLGGLFLLHNNDSSRTSSMILEYGRKDKALCIEALGQTALDTQAVQFVISALFHVARDFPGASWTGWMECGMGHGREKMYHLATSHEKQNHTPGSRIIPLVGDLHSDQWRKQRNMCSRLGLDSRGSCTLDPDVFGRVLDVKEPFVFFDEAEERAGGSENRNTDPSTTSQELTDLANAVRRVDGRMDRVEEGIGRVEEGVIAVRGGVGRVEEGLGGVEEGLDRVEGDVDRVEEGMGRVEEDVDGLRGGVEQVEEGLDRVERDVGRVQQSVGRVEKGVERVEEGVGGVEESLQRLDEDVQGIARGMQKALVLLRNLQGPNYPYPHLVVVKEVQAEGKRSLWSRLRGMFVMDMTLHFLCSFNRSEVPCGVGGHGYRLRKMRGWVKKIAPALQVTAVIAKVALRAVAGVDVPGLPEGFLQEFKTGLIEELVDRTMDEDALRRVLSGDEEAGADMQRKTKASYEAITEFMATEEARRRKTAKDGDGYVDFRDRMEQVQDKNVGLVWVRTENVQEWKDLLSTAAPST